MADEPDLTIAAALFGDEISPRFDCCTGLLVVKSDGSVERRDLRGRTAGFRIAAVLQCRPTCLLCGGIRRRDSFLMTDNGIRVIDGLCGQANAAVEALKAGLLQEQTGNNSNRADSKNNRRCRSKHEGGRNARKK